MVVVANRACASCMSLSFLRRSTDQMTFRPMIGMGQTTRERKKNIETKKSNSVSNLQLRRRPRSRTGPASACCRRPGLGLSLEPWPLFAMGQQRPEALQALQASASRRWTRAAMPYRGVVSLEGSYRCWSVKCWLDGMRATGMQIREARQQSRDGCNGMDGRRKRKWSDGEEWTGG